MKNNHTQRPVVSLLLALGVALGGTSAFAANLNDIYGVAEQLNKQARKSQARVDALTDETRTLLGEYKTVLKEIDGGKGAYLANKAWEIDLMNFLKLPEVEYVKMTIEERAYRICAMKLKGWIEILDADDFKKNPRRRRY